ncbi:MAG: A/G-specific adenine glycosylase [Bacteroidaceae bacterium]|nr:A/G-specific adenine glycosylase [Bacteroidaceae bacterium]
MEEISGILLDWYRLNRRSLPWRETRDAYRIWVSEIILQQTRVAQGLDYFLRFMERFPTVELLADADEDEVMKLWQGLGYYSRARNLHTAAKQIVAMGGFPDTYEGVRALKGVGDYTAAAICSIAYGLPHAVVDGNVYRVLSRLYGVDTPIDSASGKKEFAMLAKAMLEGHEPGEYNQAIMDFGALQCTPGMPDCSACPLCEHCIARAEGRVGGLPVKGHKTRTKNRYFNYIYVRAGAYTYINKRSDDDIWRNLYEFPLIETEKEVGEEEFYRLPQLQVLLGGTMNPHFRLISKRVKHVLSHRVIWANFYELLLPEDTGLFASYMRIREDELETFPVSRLMSLFLEKKQ